LDNRGYPSSAAPHREKTPKKRPHCTKKNGLKKKPPQKRKGGANVGLAGTP